MGSCFSKFQEKPKEDVKEKTPKFHIPIKVIEEQPRSILKTGKNEVPPPMPAPIRQSVSLGNLPLAFTPKPEAVETKEPELSIERPVSVRYEVSDIELMGASVSPPNSASASVASKESGIGDDNNENNERPAGDGATDEATDEAADEATE